MYHVLYNCSFSVSTSLHFYFYLKFQIGRHKVTNINLRKSNSMFIARLKKREKFERGILLT